MDSNILLVDDDPNSILLLGQILSDMGRLSFATSGEDAMRVAHLSPPDLILLDAKMPGLSGFDVLAALKTDPVLADIPVIIVTSRDEADFEVAGLDRGAADFIGKPVSAPIVRARVKTQLRFKHMADELRRISNTDVVSGVANRRRFDESMEHEWRRARRYGDPVALLMVDVDHFKPYNDRYGHPAGDACLRLVAQAMVGASLRAADLVARYGGEEFVVLLPLTRRRGAEYVANNILYAVEALNIAHETSPTARHVTVSIGIGCYDDESASWVSPTADSRLVNGPTQGYSATDLVRCADKALYSAKNAGRAKARLLDIADVNERQAARDIGPSRRLAFAHALN